MGLYENSTSRVRFVGGLSENFHQGSALSPLPFKVVKEEATKSIRKGYPWELLCADDLVLSAESRQEEEDMLITWNSAMELVDSK